MLQFYSRFIMTGPTKPVKEVDYLLWTQLLMNSTTRKKGKSAH